MIGYLRLGLIILIPCLILFALIYRKANRKPSSMAKGMRSLAEFADSTHSHTEPKLLQSLDAYEDNDFDVIEPTASIPKKNEMNPAPKKNKTNNGFADLITLAVVAKAGAQFASYDLLQAISATGMKYGAMNIFHYYSSTINDEPITLFSLASATEPGDFDLNRMGEFSCVGLTLFMDLQQVPDAQSAFQIMLRVAEQLADDLDAELRAGYRTPWSAEIQQQYHEKILQFDNARVVEVI